MVIIQTPNGMVGEYRLRPSETGLRLEGRCASFDLRTMLVEEGWRIQAIKTARARKRLKWAGVAVDRAGGRRCAAEREQTAA
jgi:hypothetical protein